VLTGDRAQLGAQRLVISGDRRLWNGPGVVDT
jgi:hypothetical protein